VLNLARDRSCLRVPSTHKKTRSLSKPGKSPRGSAPPSEPAVPTRNRILQAAIDEFADKGFAGGRVDAICAAANVNIRMVYHYFGDKAGLYIAVLEHVLGELRQEELKLDIGRTSPMDAILQLFDFTYEHFAAHPRLISLLSGENLLKAEFLKRSSRTPVISSPVLRLVRQILQAGEADGSLRGGLDPLQIYVTFVSLSYFHLSNGHTLSVIFERDLFEAEWLSQHKAIAREVVRRFVASAVTE
jgi:AcrR family transcriptional regulator